jgi:hypothetical protein
MVKFLFEVEMEGCGVTRLTLNDGRTDGEMRNELSVALQTA